MERRELDVLATSPFDGGQVYLKRASIDNIAFVDGLGQPVLEGENVPHINNATTARQPLDGESGLVILAADDSDGAYRFATVGGSLSATPGGFASEQAILMQTFDGLAAGSDVAYGGWQATADRGQLDVDGATLQLRSSDATAVRACAPLPPQATGWVEVAARARLVGLPSRDTAIIAVRGDGAELTGLRFQANGVIAAMSGQDRTGELGSWTPGAWYDINVRVDWAQRSWSFSVLNDDGAAVAAATELSWQRAVPVTDEVCTQLPEAGPGAMVELNAVTAERSLGGR